MIKKIVFISLFFILTACGLTTTRPKLDMSYAQAAFLAAKEAKAEIYASNVYRKAEIYYLKAKSAYRRKYFNKAKSYALLCKKFAEQAEYEAVKKTILSE